MSDKWNAHLLTAAREGDFVEVRKAIRGGADVDAWEYMGRTALMLVMWGNHPGTLER